MVKNLPANVGDHRDTDLIPGLGQSPGVQNGNPVFLPGKFHGQKSLVGYSPRDCKESDMTEHVHAHVCTHRCTCAHTHTYTLYDHTGKPMCSVEIRNIVL